MKSHRSFFLRLFLATGLLALAFSAAHAQTNLLIQGGTHVLDGSQAFAYILGQLESNQSADASINLTQPEFSIYQKSGIPATPGDYTLVGVMRPVVDEATVSALLERSWRLKPGESHVAQEAALGAKLDAMFGALSASAAGQSVAAKLATIVAAALADPQYRSDLALLGKTFPAVNMCLGFAWSGPISTAQPTTFEIRLRDNNGNDAAVTGRVTVDGTQATATPLPAPGNPVNSGIEVSTTPLPAASFSDFRAAVGNEAKAQLGFADLKSQMAFRKVNRAVRLRWSTPVTLRQRSILQNGYNLWRLPAAALDASWLSTAPTLATLRAAGGLKVNALPIMATEDLSPAQAADASDTETNFFTDEISTDTPMPGGEVDYVYFVTAMDVLGRDGLVSPGLLVTLCNRMPPATVRDLKVRNSYSWFGGAGGYGKQRLALAWSPVSSGPDGDTIQYEIYRWNRYDGAQRSIGATPIGKTYGTTFFESVSGSPTEADAHKTFWYTVRAVRVTGCGRFPAGHSGPVFGVIRDRTGPGIVSTGIERPCLDPSVVVKPVQLTRRTDSTPGRIIPVTLRCTRNRPGLAWAEFSTTAGKVLAKIRFPQSSVVEHVLTFAAETFSTEGALLATVRCRVGAINGAVSDYAVLGGQGDWSKDIINVLIPFEANLSITMVSAGQPCQHGGQSYPEDPGTDDTTDTSGTVTSDPDAVEFKYYRRVDDGPFTFIYREEKPASSGATNTSNFTDSNPPPINGGRVCYYVQAFDSDGNAGPMTLMEDGCIIFPPLAIPQPLLAKITANPAAADGSRSLKITWSCPPVGVDRFKLYISKNGFEPAAALGVDLLQNNSAAEGGELLSGQGDKRFGVYVSSRIEGRFSGLATDPPPAELPAEFSIDLPAENSATYTVAVSALGARPYANDGDVPVEGEPSNVRDGTWSQVDVSGPNVPWPDRPIPPLLEVDKVYLGDSVPPSLKTYTASTWFTAEKLDVLGFDGLAVRIGRVILPAAPQGREKGSIVIPNKRIDPHRCIFRVGVDENELTRLFPCALYRYRVNSPEDTGLTKDLVQVTPLMESIAYGFVDPVGSANPNGVNTALYDPFVQLSLNGAAGGEVLIGIYLADTLPVVRGSTYRYLLVRFNPETREPRDVIPISNALTVP